MNDIRAESRAFRAHQLAKTENARQLAALHLACGIDLTTALAAGPDLKKQLICRLERAIERERLKGMRRHWTYDLNRHIALKQVLDRLRDGTRATKLRASTASSLEHVAQKCAAVLRQRHAQKQRLKAREANLKDRDAL